MLSNGGFALEGSSATSVHRCRRATDVIAGFTPIPPVSDGAFSVENRAVFVGRGEICSSDLSIFQSVRGKVVARLADVIEVNIHSRDR